MKCEGITKKVFLKIFKIYFQCLVFNFQDGLAQTLVSRDSTKLKRRQTRKENNHHVGYVKIFWLFDMTFISDMIFTKITSGFSVHQPCLQLCRAVYVSVSVYTHEGTKKTWK